MIDNTSNIPITTIKTISAANDASTDALANAPISIPNDTANAVNNISITISKHFDFLLHSLQFLLS